MCIDFMACLRQSYLIGAGFSQANFGRSYFSVSRCFSPHEFLLSPQSDGQTERLNQTMETFLRCFVNVCPSKWSHWLSLVEYWYNNCHHSAIGCTPFVALYGYEPKHFGIRPKVATSIPYLATWLKDKEVMTSLSSNISPDLRVVWKSKADKHRSERQFAVGDQVFLKIQPYVHWSLAPRSNQKLAFKFFGPYEILERVGAMVYKLKLPLTSAIHPVFHVSQLKKLISEKVQVSPALPCDIDLPRVLV
jgi:hypothetical protein